MEKPTKKKKTFLKLIFYILIICGVFISVIYFYLPFIIESIIIPVLAPKLGIENAYLKVDTAGIHGLEISALKIFGKDNTGIKIKSLKLEAEDAEVQSLQVDGLDLYLEFIDGNLTIPGIKFPKKGNQKSKNNIFEIPPLIAPDFKLSIINSGIKMVLKKNGKLQEIEIPFEIQLERDKEVVNFISKTGSFNYKDKKIEILVPELTVTGSITPDKERLHVGGIANFANISIKADKLNIKKIEGSLPFNFCITQKGIDFNLTETPEQKKGNLTLSQIIFGKKSFGDAHFSTFQKDGSFILKGEHTGLIQEQKTYISGKITPPGVENQLAAEFQINFKGDNLDINLSEFHPKAGAANFKGDVNISAKIGFQNNKISAVSEVSVKNGFLKDKKRDLSVKDLSLGFILDDVLKLKSKPSQRLSFGSLKFKTFAFENGNIWFQTESLKRYLIEKSKFKWSGGSVESNAFRIDADKPDEIDLVLYCDRLNVGDVLNQFNVGKASGKGTVSGKIPLDYKNRRILIDEGFLYSTPGIGGNISLTDFMGPLANIPSGFQMAIAKEALSDFNYEWLRIKLNSEKDDLLLQLEMDGAPAGLMPFGYDLKQGGLYKSNDPNTKAKFKGISFQINFRLPANQMLEYGSRFQEISGKLK